MAEENLRQKTISGVQWNSIDKVATMAISLVLSIVLARILGPESYGLIGIVSIFVNVFYTFVDSGFSSALIRKETITEDDYSTAFIFNLIVSITLYLLLFIFAPLVARFFNQPMLTQLLRVMGVMVIINAICLTQVTKLSRDINFKVQAKVSILSVIVCGIVGIGMAVSGCGVWSLVGQQLSLYGARAFLLCYFNRWMPKLRFSKESFSYMFGFGWKVLLSNVISSIWVQGNKIIIGKMYPAQTLGYYTKSQEWPNQIANNFGGIVRTVSFPALSKIQDEPDRLLTNFRKIFKMSFFFSVMACLGISAVSYSLVLTLYGSEWEPAVKFIQIVSLSFIFHAPILFVLSILQIKNRTDLFLMLEVIGKLAALIPFALGIKYGIMWLIWGSVALSAFQFTMDVLFTGKQIGYTMKMLIKDMMPSVLVGVVMYAAVWPIKLVGMPVQLMLVVQVLVGVIVVLALSRGFKLEEYQEIVGMVKPWMDKVLKKNKQQG